MYLMYVFLSFYHLITCLATGVEARSHCFGKHLWADVDGSSLLDTCILQAHKPLCISHSLEISWDILRWFHHVLSCFVVRVSSKSDLVEIRSDFTLQLQLKKWNLSAAKIFLTALPMWSQCLLQAMRQQAGAGTSIKHSRALENRWETILQYNSKTLNPNP